MSRPVRFITRAIVIVLLLIAIWNYQLIYQLAKPSIISLNPSWSQVQVTDGAQVSGDSTFSYPRLGIQAPISINPTTSPLVSQDWSTIRADLMHGVSLAFPGSTFANTPLAFLTGHSSDTTHHPYDAIFAGLGQAKVGDTFSLVLDDTVYVYQVTTTEQLTPTNSQGFLALAPPEDTHLQRVALVTCWPPLTTTRRLVVLGERTASSLQ